MNIFRKLFSSGQDAEKYQPKINDKLFLSYDPIETNINRLPDFYWAAVDNVRGEGIENDPISYVNSNMHVRCPKCGVDYNANGFEMGLLSSLVEIDKRGTPTTFTSGDKGIYPRCIKGLCLNHNCASIVATVRWLGNKTQTGRIPYGTLIAAFIFKNGSAPPSQNECNAFLNTDPDYRKGQVIEIRSYGGITKNVDAGFILMFLAKNKDEHLIALFLEQIATWTVVEKNDLMMVKIFETFYVDNPPGFFIIAFVLQSGDEHPTIDLCNNFVSSDSAYQPGRAGKVQIHPISGWDRRPLTSLIVFNLVNKFHPNIVEGIKKREIFYDFRLHEGDNEHLLIRVFGNKYWNEFVSSGKF